MSGSKLQKPVVGVTGIPGSGKTAFVRLLVDQGADLVDVDLAGKWAIEENDHVREQIRLKFGNEYFDGDNLIRKKLGALVFSDEIARNKLNAIVHPVMLARVDELIFKFKNKSQNKIILVDAALLFELEMDKKCDQTVTVWADLEKCIERSIQRDNITREQAIQRIQSQFPQEEKKQQADYLVENNGSDLDLKSCVDDLFFYLVNLNE